MLRSASTRCLLSRLSAAAPLARLRLSTAASPQPTPPQSPFEQEPATPSSEAGSSEKEPGDSYQRRRAGSSGGAGYEEEQARVLRAALPHVSKLGWSESAMITGARDVGVSPSIVGSFPRKEAALVEFFMENCLERLIDRIDKGEELQSSLLSNRLSELIRMRLEMQVPYISKWPQALSIQAQPMNLQTSFNQRALLVDEICHAAGVRGSDIDWYVKRTILGGLYSTTELYMLTDHSSEFRESWMFLERRIKDAFDFQKTVQEAAYLAETIGAGMGKSMPGFMKNIFKG